MLKIFLIYALIAGALMFPWFYTFYRGELEEGIKEVSKETNTTIKSCTIVLNILLFVLGWIWIPSKIIKAIIKKVKGNNES